jgi:hypothetical protein
MRLRDRAADRARAERGVLSAGWNREVGIELETDLDVGHRDELRPKDARPHLSPYLIYTGAKLRRSSYPLRYPDYFRTKKANEIW